MGTTRRTFLQTAAAAAFASSLPHASSAAPAGERAAALSGASQQDANSAVCLFAGDFFLTSGLAPATELSASALAELCRSADAVIANLENGLSTVGRPELGAFRQGPSLRGDPSLVSELEAMNVRAVSLANNHTGNYGREALMQTCNVLDKARIVHAGCGADIDAAFAPALLKLRGRTVALCSVYSYYSNFQANDSAGPDTPGVAACRAYDVLVELPTAFDTSRQDEPPYRVELEAGGRHRVMAPLRDDVERMMAAVREARRRADFVVVSAHLHWGRHLRHDIPAQKQAFARAAIDAGADLFVGHGPHVIRGIELYRGRPIAHSLGNFVLQRSSKPDTTHAQRPSPSREGVLLRVTLSDLPRLALEVIPIVIPGDGRPRLADDNDATRITQRVLALSAALGTELNEGDGGRARLSL